MQILAGRYKGRKLSAGPDLSIRPVINRVKASIFDTLGPLDQALQILDLFCGAGSLGLEALSRGAENVTFVDNSGPAIKILRKNLQSLQIPNSMFRIIQESAMTFCRRSGLRYQLIFMDPPFNFMILQELVEAISAGSLLDANGLLIVQHEITNPIDAVSDRYRIVKQTRMGRSLISFIEHGASHG